MAKPMRNAVEVVEAACGRLEARRELGSRLTYEAVKGAWDGVLVKHSKVRAEAAQWLALLPPGELEGRDVALDFTPRVAEAVRALRGLGGAR